MTKDHPKQQYVLQLFVLGMVRRCLILMEFQMYPHTL